MRKLLLTTGLLAFGLTPAFAQTVPASPGAAGAAPSSPPAASGPQAAGPQASGPSMGNPMMGGEMGQDGGRMREAWRHMGGSGAASFRFRRGNADIDIRCAVREPTQICVQAALILLDKVGGMHKDAQPQ